MNTNQLQAFLSVAETKSFNQSEKKLFISRQALKKQIDSLEAELGFKLFIRTHFGAALTSVGEEFYNGYLNIQEQLDSLISNCRDASLHDSSIRIGNSAQPRLMLEKTFAEFYKKFPDTKQEVVFIDEQKTIDLVLDGSVDVAECIWTPAVAESNVGYYKLSDMPYKCLVSPTHPLARNSSIRLSDLDSNTVGLRKTSNSRIINKLQAECPNITLVETKGNKYEQQHIFSICYSQGIFITRSYYANFMAPLVTIPLDVDISAECGIIYRKPSSQAVKNYLSVVKECFPH